MKSLLSAFLLLVTFGAPRYTSADVPAKKHLVFNGYYAGMSKSAAKIEGFEHCRYGIGLSETSDSIYCEIPAQSRSLGTMVATKAVLEFRLGSREVVTNIKLNFSVTEDQVKTALVSTYGPPTSHEDDPTYDNWERGPETLKLARLGRSNQRAYITFSYSDRLGRSRVRAAEEKRRKQEELKSF